MNKLGLGCISWHDAADFGLNNELLWLIKARLFVLKKVNFFIIFLRDPYISDYLMWPIGKSTSLCSFRKLFTKRGLFSNYLSGVCFYLHCVKGRGVIQRGADT